MTIYIFYEFKHNSNEYFNFHNKHKSEEFLEGEIVFNPYNKLNTFENTKYESKHNSNENFNFHNKHNSDDILEG